MIQLPLKNAHCSRTKIYIRMGGAMHIASLSLLMGGSRAADLAAAFAQVMAIDLSMITLC